MRGTVDSRRFPAPPPPPPFRHHDPFFLGCAFRGSCPIARQWPACVVAWVFLGSGRAVRPSFSPMGDDRLVVGYLGCGHPGVPDVCWSRVSSV